MPAILIWSVGAAGFGLAAKWFGDGIEDTAKATRDLAIVGGIGFAAYLVAKKQGII